MKKILPFLIALCFNTLQAQTSLTTAVDFTVTDVQGNQHNLFNLLDNGQYVCIDFFFTTCPPCIATVPFFDEAYHNYGCNNKDIYFISIDTGDSDGEVINYINAHLGGSMALPMVSGNDGGGNNVVNAYGVGAFPTYILIHPDHSILEQDMYPISSVADFDSYFSSHALLPQPCTVTPPGPFTDGTIQSLMNSGTFCSDQVTPSFSFTNLGDTTIHSFTVEYSLTGGTVQTYTWTGVLAINQSVTISLPTLVANLGNQQLNFHLTNVNGNADGDNSNDQSSTNFTINAVAGQQTPIMEGFEGGVFPPPSFDIVNAAGTTWQKTNAAARSGVSSVYIDNFSLNNSAGAVDDLHLGGFAFPANQTIMFSFDLAYAPYTVGASDTLDVLISTDCGMSYQVLYHLSGSDLYTTNSTLGAFVPTQANQWKHFNTDLTMHAGNSNVQFIFRNTSAYENNLYLDNINLITSAVSIDNPNDLGVVHIFPNPANEILNIEYQGTTQGATTAILSDLSGKLVKTQTLTLNQGFNLAQMQLSDLAKGIYMLQVGEGEKAFREKVIVK